MKRNTFLNIAFVFVCVLIFSISNAQDKSNRGREFWLAYGFDYTFFNEIPVNSQDLAVYISTEEAAIVTVSITNTGFTQTLNIPANMVDATIIIPKSGPNDARTLTDGLQNRNIHIVSDVSVAVYAHVYANQVSGATMLMPVETNGFVYHSINYYQTTSQSSPNDWYSWFYAIASEDNTRLEITPTDTTKNGWLPGQTYIVNLNKGESYHVFGKALFNGNPAFASKDMTGSKVVSVAGADGNCHPFALYSGSGGIRLCRGDGGEFMQQQVFPAQAWGTRYLTYHTINNTSTNILETNRNYYRVCVLDPTTVVKKNGVNMTGLIRNFFYEYLDSTGGDYIEADKPILISQYMVNKNQCWNFPTTSPSPPSYGDPEMFYLSPIEQGQKAVRFYVSRKSTIDYVYVNIHTSTSAVSSLSVDGNPVPASQIIPHPNFPSSSVAVVRFIGPASQHTITCDSTFNATVYGLGNYESYGYNVGTFINNLNAYGGIKNTLSTTGNIDTVSCPTTPLRLFVKLAYQANSITWKLSQVPGITPNTDSIVNLPVPVGTEIINGRTYYIYSLQQDFSFATIGTYVIPVLFTSTVIGNCSNTENVSLKILIKPGPKADFNFPSACPNQTITLTGAASANGFNIVNYLWNFPDATTQSTVNATKAFPSIGTYNIRYRLFADNGCVGDTTKPLVIGSPLAATVTGVGKACADSTFTFTSSLLQDATNPRTWYWDFGDGTSTSVTTTNTVTHTYAALNNTRTLKHSVNFTVGCSTDTASFVIPIIKPNPVANFQILRDTLCAGRPLAFSSSLTNINTWLWNFGNGTGSQVPPFLRSYAQAGPYNVQLIVKDINGCGSLPATDQLNINPLPNVNAGADVFVNPGNNTILQATVLPPASYNYLWTPSATISANNILQPIATPTISTTYFLLATNPASFCSVKDSVEVKIISKLYVPNAFAPTRDAKNLVWRIPGINQYPGSLVTVYNRYGQKIYETNNNTANPWNGTYQGEQAPAGSYVYIIQLNNTTKDLLKGTIMLIR